MTIGYHECPAGQNNIESQSGGSRQQQNFELNVSLLFFSQGNVTKKVTLVVIDSNAPQCETNTTKTNKGVYVWKETVAGVTKELPCKLGEGRVSHYCDKNAHWTNLNLSQCDFTNEWTRKLQNLAEVN